jgi:DNA-binding SARP family transcriptional activator
VEFRILGPLEVMDDGRALQLGGTKQRSLLALLLVNANEVVAADRLVDELWREDAPERAHNALQVYVSQLRKLIEPNRAAGASPQVLVTQAPGYVIRVEEHQLDLRRFERLVAEARSEDSPAEAAAKLREALALWRGEPLADLRLEHWAQAEIPRLEEARTATLEDRIEVDLALGRHADLVGELESLVVEHPLRERLRAQRMLALYRSGRQADAIAAYRRAHRAFADELGIEPGLSLRALQRAILVQEPSLHDEVDPFEAAAALLPTDEARRAEALLEYADALARRARAMLDAEGEG